MRFTLPLAIEVDVRVRQDPIQPRLEIGPGLVLVKGGESLRVRFLDQILRIRLIASHAQGGGVELIDVLHCFPFETSLALLVRFTGQID